MIYPYKSDRSRIFHFVKDSAVLLILIILLGACESGQKETLVLFDFESEAGLDEVHWKCHTLYSLSNLHAAHGGSSLKLEMYPSAYPGLSPVLTRRNWQGYGAFCFEVYNPMPHPVLLSLRIDDKKEALEYTDRYQKSFQIQPGPNSIQIPLESLKTSETLRPLNLKTIHRFLVFMVNPETRHVLYLDYFRLEPFMREVPK